MNLKRFLALTLTGIITFSNVAYAAEDVSALENSADPAVVEEAAEDTAEDPNVVYEDADSVFDAVDEEITEEETEAEELLTEDSEEAVTIFEDEEEVTVEPVFEMMEADREMELYDKLDSAYEMLVSSYDIEVPEDTEFPVTITMEDDILAGDEVLVYHFDEGAVGRRSFLMKSLTAR